MNRFFNPMPPGPARNKRIAMAFGVIAFGIAAVTWLMSLGPSGDF